MLAVGSICKFLSNFTSKTSKNKICIFYGIVLKGRGFKDYSWISENIEIWINSDLVSWLSYSHPPVQKPGLCCSPLDSCFRVYVLRNAIFCRNLLKYYDYKIVLNFSDSCVSWKLKSDEKMNNFGNVRSHSCIMQTDFYTGCPKKMPF